VPGRLPAALADDTVATHTIRAKLQRLRASRATAPSASLTSAEHTRTPRPAAEHGSTFFVTAQLEDVSTVEGVPAARVGLLLEHQPLPGSETRGELSAAKGGRSAAMGNARAT
jgi:hypothetical protein